MECLICYSVPQEDIKFDHGISTVICKLLKIPEELFPGFLITSNVCFDCSQLIKQAQFLYQDLEDINCKIGKIYEVIENKLVESQKLSEVNGNILQDRNKIVNEINSRKGVEGSTISDLNLIDIKCEVESSTIFTNDFDGPIDIKSELYEENLGNNSNNIHKELKVVIEPLVIPSNYKIANEPMGFFLRKNQEKNILIAEKLKNPRKNLPYESVEVNEFSNNSSAVIKENCVNTSAGQEEKPRKTKKLAKSLVKSETKEIKAQDQRERLPNTEIGKPKRKSDTRRKVNSLKIKNICSKCAKEFKSEYALRVHSFSPCNVSDSDTDRKNTTCAKCSKSYQSPFRLREHIKFVHFKNNRYQCDKCPKIYCQPLRLKQHFLMNHTNERPHKCSICPKGFVTATRLKRHEALHTGSTDFICHICGFKYYILDSLNVHMRENHSEKELQITRKRKRKFSQRIFKINKVNQITSEESDEIKNE